MNQSELILSIEKFYLKGAASNSVQYELYQNSLVERIFNAKMYSNKWDGFMAKLSAKNVAVSEISLMGALAPCYRFSYHKYDLETRYDCLLIFHISIIAPVYSYFVDVQFMDRPTSRTGLFKSYPIDISQERRSKDHDGMIRMWNIYPNLLNEEMSHVLQFQNEIFNYEPLPNDVTHNLVDDIALSGMTAGESTYFDFLFTRDRWSKV